MAAEKPMRKALESRLKAQQAALLAEIPASILESAEWPPQDEPAVPIWWPNFAQPRSPVFLRPTFHPNRTRYPEMGRNSRKDVDGSFLVGIYTPPEIGVDLGDNLANVVEAAYPYAQPLGPGTITGVGKREGALDEIRGRWFTPVHINWEVLRA